MARRIEREIARQTEKGSICVAVGDCEFLICFAEERGARAHMAAFQIMEDLLTYFLGGCSREDLQVKRVASLSPGEIETVPLDRREVESARKREIDAEPAALPRPRLVTAIVGAPAERLSVRLSPQRMVHLASRLTIGQRMAIAIQRIGTDRALTPSEETELSTNGLIEASLLAANTVKSFMAASDQPGAFALPLFLPSLASARGRNALIDVLRGFSPAEGRRLLVEIVGVGQGTPSSRVTEAAASVRPYCRGVIGRSAFSRSGFGSLASTRLSGVSLSVKELGAEGPQMAAGLLAAGQAARKLAPMLLATDVPDGSVLDICGLAGFSHAAIAEDARA